MTINIIIADDHPAIRSALRLELGTQPDMHLVAEAADGDAALGLVQQHRPDVLLADISMPGPSGIQLAAMLRDTLPLTRVLIMTGYEDLALMDEAMNAGAAGYIVKWRLDGQLMGVIRTVASGATYFPHDLAARSPPQADAPSYVTPDHLSPEDLELIGLIARTYTTRQIAAKLGVDPAVVENRQAVLLRELGLQSRIDLVRYALAYGLLG